MKMNEMKVKAMLNHEILCNMNDGSAAQLLRGILFDGNNKINWDQAYLLMMVYMPELQNIDSYRVENMR